MKKILLVSICLVFSATAFGLVRSSAVPMKGEVVTIPTGPAPCCQGGPQCTQFNEFEGPACAQTPGCTWVPQPPRCPNLPAAGDCCTGTSTTGAICSTLTGSGSGTDKERCQAQGCTWGACK